MMLVDEEDELLTKTKPNQTKPNENTSAIAVAGTTLYMFGGYDGTQWYNGEFT